jgi:flagellar basal body-associated protein FliL
MIEDKGMDDPFFKNDTNCCKKHLKTIIFILVGIVLISVIIVLIILLTKKEDKKEKTYEYEFGLNMDELRNKTDPNYMFNFTFLNPNSVEYTSLEEGDKKALKYLVKAAVIFQNIHFRIDEPNNIPFKNFLEKKNKRRK